ncbi:hypothetical protein ALP66_103156 [Pseudomonas amygdali pv. photiniae]|uniref:Uncharacterized protein n=8 Tax=Pseudomonas syringae group TaxID=136849 RepID=A0A3M5EYI9_PSESS|nr:hypothetical protein ALO90_102894 [Pseudomonas amygdali pv. aesculi]KPW74192.1 hypothetical protein ALO78_102424 [Pseudomonas amygdali pv. ciccaronei]KPW91272.1 hypothetical protein ALO79_100780 [Pseudomonas syringae pv. castaneae]KPX08689.1 hypothetical protein ALO73_102930 [Pseudomonas syringae pv. daphniphylli]KPX10254.1 hypothetical protein ALO74_102706 [Pseudomonas syringae pv. cunninghamiae]KPX20026.1 hypothetical protein ALO71_102647 [Pseudomonas amygdali pv. dendropanacis]KPX29322.
MGTASGIRVAPLAQENNPDQQCTGHAQSPAVTLATAQSLACRLLRRIASRLIADASDPRRRTHCRFAVVRATARSCLTA